MADGVDIDLYSDDIDQSFGQIKVRIQLNLYGLLQIFDVCAHFHRFASIFVVVVVVWHCNSFAEYRRRNMVATMICMTML